MRKIKSVVDFEILIDDSFQNLKQDTNLTPIENKNVLSIINDFADGHWRYEKFHDFVWDNISETALSYKDRNALIDRSRTTLRESAKKLRLTDLSKDQDGQGSELAEIVLYGIMKHHYNAVPAVPKIFYKQNSQDNAKGSDSVHIVIESEDTFSIWLGEAKFYNSIEDERLYSVVDSVVKSLKTDKLEKENSIITSVTDLKECLKDKEDLYKEIIQTIKTGASIDHMKSNLHVPILLLHECNITAANCEMSEAYKNELINYYRERAESYFNKQINKAKKLIYKYSEIHFHLILFPVPEKEPIINNFVENVIHYQNQSKLS